MLSENRQARVFALNAPSFLFFPFLRVRQGREARITFMPLAA
jgi:hypothetical protein